MTNPWLSIIKSDDVPSPVKAALKPNYVNSTVDKEKPQRRKSLIDIIGTLLCVCPNSVRIYDVLKTRGLLKKTNGIGNLSLKYVKDLTMKARAITGIKFVNRMDRVVQLLDAGMHYKDVAERIGMDEQSIKNIKYALRKKRANRG